MPGSRGTLLSPSPLRTGLDTFASSGSSKLHSHRVWSLIVSQRALVSLVGSHLLVAKKVEEDQIIECVWSTFIPPHDMVCFVVFIIE